ncbi:MAG: hypothetical protein U9N87_01520, partial [Planctomycetota bacterium]|nr:hypothetical protein [Planctomycetota bacterium]
GLQHILYAAINCGFPLANIYSRTASYGRARYNSKIAVQQDIGLGDGKLLNFYGVVDYADAAYFGVASFW